MKQRAIFLTCAAASAFALIDTAAAQSTSVNSATQQEEPRQGLEDIVVTAQRRAESVQDVPVAVSAFSAAELERRNISEPLDLVQYVPNLIGSHNQGIGSANSYFIRGLGNTEALATFDPPVGTYIDDIYLARQNANNFGFFDIERIEVLRGPQGTLFGRNTTGGAVSIITRKPGKDAGGYLEAGIGSYNRTLLRGSVDLPLSENLLTKFSSFWQRDDGYIKNTTTGERLNADDTYGLRAAVRFVPTDRFTWDVAASYTHAISDNVLNFDCDPGNPSVCNGRFSTSGLRRDFPANQTQFPTLPITGPKARFPVGNRTDALILSSNASFDVGSATVSLITGYVRINQDFAFDFFDGRASPSFSYGLTPAGQVAVTTILAPRAVVRLATGGFDIINDGLNKQFTQEVKVTGKAFDGLIDYVGGAYYLKETNRTDFADVFTSAASGTASLLNDRLLLNDTRAIAGYVQADINPTEQIKLTAGIRYTDEKKTLSISDLTPLTVQPNLALRLTNDNLALYGIPRQQTARLWTPRFAANYKPSRDILLFASATRGFRSGGWSARASTAPNLLPFGPEKVWSYEAGLKSEFLDKRVRVNITGFITNVRDFQVPTAFINPLGQITFITGNFAGLRNNGVEVELQAVPTNGLTLYANAGFQNARYRIPAGQQSANQLARCQAALANGLDPIVLTDTRTAPARAQAFCANGIVTAQGRIAKPPRSPRLSLSAGANYAIESTGLGVTFTPAVNVSYTSDYETGAANLSIFSSGGTLNVDGGDFITGSRAEARAIINASIAVETLDRAWRGSLECDNCLDKTAVESVTGNYSYLNEPRRVMLRVRHNF